jgi:hypothetical protein
MRSRLKKPRRARRPTAEIPKRLNKEKRATFGWFAGLDSTPVITYKPAGSRAKTLNPKCFRLPRDIARAQVAQLVEQRTENPRVGGSIPPLGTMYFNYLVFPVFL